MTWQEIVRSWGRTPLVGDVYCKGAWVLGSACGRCKRCATASDRPPNGADLDELRRQRIAEQSRPEVEIVEVGPRTSLSERLRSAADRGTTLPDALQKDDLPPLWLRRLLHEAADALEPKRWPPEDDSLVIAYIPGEGWGTDRRSDVEEWAEAGGLPVPTLWWPLPDPPKGGGE